MAELEVLKHTKKAFTIMKSEGTWWHKLKEIAIEIVIIVFAVSLSIWLHSRSELNHDRQDAKLFLEGLKIDLLHDVKEMNDDLFMYRLVSKGFTYFKKVAYGEKMNTDSLALYKTVFYNTTMFNPNESRFEGLKATGRLTIIENKHLLDNILYFYQENVPFLNMLNQNFTAYKMTRLGPMLDQKLIIDKNGIGNWEQVLQHTELQNALSRSVVANEIVGEYEKTIKMAQEVIAAIEKELEQ